MPKDEAVTELTIENGLGTQGLRDKWNGISSLVTRRHGLNSRPVRPLEPRELAPCSWERTRIRKRSWTGNVAIQAPSSSSPFPLPPPCPILSINPCLRKPHSQDPQGDNRRKQNPLKGQELPEKIPKDFTLSFCSPGFLTPVWSLSHLTTIQGSVHWTT